MSVLPIFDHKDLFVFLFPGNRLLSINSPLNNFFPNGLQFQPVQCPVSKHFMTADGTRFVSVEDALAGLFCEGFCEGLTIESCRFDQTIKFHGARSPRKRMARNISEVLGK